MHVQAEENNEEVGPDSDIDTWEIPVEAAVGEARRILAAPKNF